MSTTHPGLKSGTFNVTAHERILFGTPAAEAVVAEAERYGARRVFITSTRSLAQKEDGPLQRLERALGAAHVGTYAAIRSHSPREDVVAGANAARAAACRPAGGRGRRLGDRRHQGHAALPLGRPRHARGHGALLPGLRAHADVRPRRCPPTPIRMITVSTTLSASEFTDNAGITNSATNTKQSFRHRLFAPRTIVLDPAATLDTPDWLLFCTGIRSVDHAVESYCNAQASLATEALSLQGLKLLHRALPAIKSDPADLGAAARGAARHVAGDRAAWPPACRRAPATASATRWAQPSASPTATPPASCCRRC